MVGSSLPELYCDFHVLSILIINLYYLSSLHFHGQLLLTLMIQSFCCLLLITISTTTTDYLFEFLAFKFIIEMFTIKESLLNTALRRFL